MAQQNNNSNNNNNDNTSHLPNHLQNGSAPPSPSTTNAQQGGGSASARQPASYPSPTSYPSPSMANSQQYGYPAPQQQGNEAYRASPTGSNGSLSLPSMRSLDPLQQQHGHHMGSPLPSVTPMTQQPYYQSSTHTLPHPSYSGVTSDPSGMRYALPQQDSRIMSGGRHKKVRVGGFWFSHGRNMLTTVFNSGNQASNQDWLFDLSQAENKGASSLF